MRTVRPLADDCFVHDKDRMRHDEALGLLRDRITPVAGMETIALEDGLDRVLAASLVAPRDVPLTDNSAVDGYAFAHQSYMADNRLTVADRVAAGHPLATALTPGSAARIFTGAVMPEGADTVAMQEDCTIREVDGQTRVEIPPGLKPGANRRRAGEDLSAGSPVLEPGHRLRPQDLAAIASLGLDKISVRERLRVALISNGDEIVQPGTDLSPGQVYDSNRYLLAGLLAAADVDVTPYGILPDDPDRIREALLEAAGSHHVVISSGGASRGEEDHILTLLDQIGTRHVWQIAVKPGRPMIMGRIGGSVFAGLPGNPVAVLVCFLLYVRPMLSRLSGADWPEPARYNLPARFAMPKKKPDRREFLRGILVRENGRVIGVDKFDRDGSGLITGLRAADGLVEIPEETLRVEAGDPVAFIPFSEFGLSTNG